jgi:hypothetical protein
MALNALPKPSTVTQWSIIPQGGCKLCKFSKVFDIQLHPVSVIGKRFEKGDVGRCNLQMKGLLPLFAEMVIRPSALRKFSLRKAWDVQFQREAGDIPIFKFLGHHPGRVNIILGQLQHLLNIICNAAWGGPVAHKKEHNWCFCHHCIGFLKIFKLPNG